jgi:hypothetical protein
MANSGDEDDDNNGSAADDLWKNYLSPSNAAVAASTASASAGESTPLTASGCGCAASGSGAGGSSGGVGNAPAVCAGDAPSTALVPGSSSSSSSSAGADQQKLTVFHSAAGEFLKQREYQGLVRHLPGAEEGGANMEIMHGQFGVAASYTYDGGNSATVTNPSSTAKAASADLSHVSEMK